MRIGVVNWDCSLPPDTFFGSYFAKTMSFRKWRTRTPYYADIISEDNICCHYKTPQEYDRELGYAIAAKIDYFAYVWHTDDKTAEVDPARKTSVTHPHAWTQDYCRKLHQNSALSEKIGLCAIWLSSQPYTESDCRNLAEAMKASYYEKVDGRPLVYVFGGYLPEAFAILRSFPKKYQTEDPYIVFLNNGAESPDGDYSMADGVSAYACGGGNINSYRQLAETMLAENEDRKKYGLDIIPLFSTGWDPTPRIETPVPWCSYPVVPYAKTAESAEIEEGARHLATWIVENRVHVRSGHIMTFAWNEFEEGGYICPTYRLDGSISEERIGAFANAVDIWSNL